MGFKQWWRSMRYGHPVLIVSGLPRSGTSMAMKMLDAAGYGVVTDGEREADIDNPKGYFEDERVKDLEGMEDKSWGPGRTRPRAQGDLLPAEGPAQGQQLSRRLHEARDQRSARLPAEDARSTRRGERRRR